MKLLKNSVTTLLLGLFIIGLASNVNAQDKRKAVETYNQALELMKASEYQQAITQFNNALSQAEALGEEGQDIIERVHNQLPAANFELAKNAYRNFQNDKTISNLDRAIEAFRQAAEVSEEYGNEQIAEKAPNIITQLMYNKALVQYQQKEFETAMTTLDEVIERNANYAKAYYQKGIVAKNMDGRSLDEALGFFDQAIEVGNEIGDNQIATRAQNAAAEELVYQGSQAIENSNYSQALEYLNRALDYNSESASAYYRLAEAYNGQQNWQQAAQAAQKGLDLSNGGRTDNAKFYYTLGTAYQGMGQKSDACGAFENASYGTFKSSAEHKMEYELKCDS